MEYGELIRERYSCKKYSAQQVEKQALEEILEAGRLAPTARNSQEQRIYVLSSPDALERFDSVCPCRYGAPTVLLVAYDEGCVFTYPGGKYDSGAEDASIVATHMMLAARNAGVDSCWLNFLDPDKAAETFALPENERVVMALDLGYEYLGTSDADVNNAEFTAIRTHNIVTSLRFMF